MPVVQVIGGMRREFPCVESMFRFKIETHTIRVWRDEKQVGKYEPGDLSAVRDEVARNHDGEYTLPHEIAERFARCDRVSAVEVLDLEGNGIVLYVTW